MTFFGLKQGQDLQNQATRPLKNSQEYSPPPTPHVVCYILSVLSSCMATGRISLNNGSILVVHCLIGRLLSAALYDCIICFLLVRLLQFYVLYNIIFQSGLSMMEHFRV